MYTLYNVKDQENIKLTFGVCTESGYLSQVKSWYLAAASKASCNAAVVGCKGGYSANTSRTGTLQLKLKKDVQGVH